MNHIFMLLLMIFCHIIADFNLQGWLATAKQIEYWEDQCMLMPNKELYKLDYLAALVTHSFAWTFLVMLPAAIWLKTSWVFFLLFALNVIIHAVVDHLKCNMYKINLLIDQGIHIIQIIATLWILVEVQ